jgi:NAD-dependent oxidoreductase involved in siderophore biosynthesis
MCGEQGVKYVSNVQRLAGEFSRCVDVGLAFYVHIRQASKMIEYISQILRRELIKALQHPS